jgi:hypothetical protein
MANSDKNIRIVPNKNSTTDTPFIRFVGQSNAPILLRVLDDNTLSFEGSSGQLFSLNNNLSTGWIFAVSDISGIPSFRINADGTIGLAEYSGNIGIGTAGVTPAFKITAGTNTATSTATPLTASLGGTYSSTAGANPKLRLYYDGTNSSGFGYSNNQLEVVARSTDDFVWYFGGSQKARLTSDGNLGLTSSAFTSKLFLETNSATQNGLIIKGFASQSANLLSIQDSTAADKFIVASNGALTNYITTAGGTTSVRAISVYGDGSENFYVTKGGYLAGNIVGNLSQNTNISFGGDRHNVVGPVWFNNNVFFVGANVSINQYTQRIAFTAQQNANISIGVIAASWNDNYRAFGILSPGLGDRSYFGGYGNLVINITGYNSSVGWDATNLLSANIDNFSTYTGNLAQFSVSGTNRFVIGPNANTQILLSSNSAVGLIIKGTASQSANLLELQDSTGAAKTYFTSDGKLRISGVTNHSDTSIPKISVYHDNGGGGGILVKGQNSDMFAGLEVQSNGGATFRAFPSGLVEAIKYTGYQIVLNSTVYPGSTEFIMFNSPAGLMEYNAAGTIALQRNFNIQGHILRFSGSPTTISKAVVVQLSGANSAGSNCTITENIVLRVLTNITTAKGIVVQAASSQTANLLEIQDSSGAILSYFNPSGSFLPTTSGLALGGSSNRWNLYATSGDFNNTVSLSPTASTTELRFYELASNGADYTAFKAPNIHEQSITYTLPAVAPALNQVLTASAVSGGNVTLGWGASSSGTLSGGGTQYAIPMWTNTSSLGDSIMTQNSAATQITVAGNFRATTKSFLIQHPTYPDKLLEHGSLEGPEHGAYIRGKASGINYVTIQLPQYFIDLIEEDYSIYITPRCNCGLFVASQSQNSFTIKRTGLLYIRKIKIEFDYFCVGDRKDQKLILVQDKG